MQEALDSTVRLACQVVRTFDRIAFHDKWRGSLHNGIRHSRSTIPNPPANQLKTIFRAHGVTGGIKEVIPRAQDEAVFLVTEDDAVATTDRDLALELQRLLGRKVWIVLDSAPWKGNTTDL